MFLQPSREGVHVVHLEDDSRSGDASLACPIRASLGVLGRKWACPVLRDVAFFGEMTFTGILRNSSGLTPRVLSMRLRDLRQEGLIDRVVNPENPREVRYRLTAKGEDAVPILAALNRFGIRYHAARVFEDGKPREMGEVFPRRQKRMLRGLRPYANQGRTPE